jgi:hypothetical protein
MIQFGFVYVASSLPHQSALGVPRELQPPQPFDRVDHTWKVWPDAPFGAAQLAVVDLDRDHFFTSGDCTFLVRKPGHKTTSADWFVSPSWTYDDHSVRRPRTAQGTDVDQHAGWMREAIKGRASA